MSGLESRRTTVKDREKKVEKWMIDTYGGNFIFSEELEHRQTIQYTKIETPFGMIVTLHASPSTKGDVARIFWNFL